MATSPPNVLPTAPGGVCARPAGGLLLAALGILLVSVSMGEWVVPTRSLPPTAPHTGADEAVAVLTALPIPCVDGGKQAWGEGMVTAPLRGCGTTACSGPPEGASTDPCRAVRIDLQAAALFGPPDRDLPAVLEEPARRALPGAARAYFEETAAASWLEFKYRPILAWEQTSGYGAVEASRAAQAESAAAAVEEQMDQLTMTFVGILAANDSRWGRRDANGQRRHLNAEELDALADLGWNLPSPSGIIAAWSKAVRSRQWPVSGVPSLHLRRHLRQPGASNSVRASAE